MKEQSKLFENITIIIVFGFFYIKAKSTLGRKANIKNDICVSPRNSKHKEISQ